MTKIQIFAKVGWNGLMLYFLGLTLAMFNVRPMLEKQPPPALADSIPCLAMCACAGLLLWGCYAIRLPLRLAGQTTIPAEPDWKPFFIQAHRLACVFVGLILLSGRLEAIGILAQRAAGLPQAGREWVSLWVEGSWNSAIGQTAQIVRSLFYPFGFLLFCGYLLVGADGFVRRQLNRFETCLSKEPCNE